MASWTVREVLQWTTQDLAERKSLSARLDAEVLLADALGTDRVGLYLAHDRLLGEEERARYRAAVGRRRSGEPVAYITGRKEFWALDMFVDPRVLIPRPETEVLVEEALVAMGAAREGGRGLDVGTGSGAIAIALLHEWPTVHFDAIDCAAGALEVAERNALRHGVRDRAQLLLGNLDEPVRAGPHYDLVTANLPYIPSAELEALPVSVRSFEPHVALDGGPDGLHFIKALVGRAPELVAPGGALVLEVGAGQATAVADVVVERGLCVERVRKDYAGVDRVVVVRRP